MEEELQGLKGTALAEMLGESLDSLSLDELDIRKKLLVEEISRIEAAIEQKKGSRNAAEAIFGNVD